MNWLEEGRGVVGEAPGAIAGGFLAYVLHTAYHSIWRKPGHWLAKRLGRKNTTHE